MPVKKHIPQTNSSNDGASLPSVAYGEPTTGTAVKRWNAVHLHRKEKEFFFCQGVNHQKPKNGSLHKTSFSAHAKKKKKRKEKTRIFDKPYDVVRGMRDDRTRACTPCTQPVLHVRFRARHFASETHVRVRTALACMPQRSSLPEAE